ncbi:MAG: methyl-accepting chemotaxis protein [Roseburia sp.]|nr:methyl-accepting chemotaxis protein [Roseburia sp.]
MAKENAEQKGIVSIKLKLLGVIVPIVIVIIVVLVLIAYMTSARVIENYSENLLESSVENQVSQIEAWLNENIAAFQIVKSTIETTQPDEKELQTMLDTYYNYNSDYPQGLYIADENGKVWKASESEMSEDDPLNSTWYQEGLSRVNMAIGSPYTNSQGVNVISASGILNDGSGTTKVISADMTLDRITVIVNAFIEMKNAEAFLIDVNSGTILAHRDSALISTKLGAEGSTVFEKSVAQKIAERDYDFCTLEGNMTVFKEVSGTSWVLVSYIPTKIVLADMMELRTIMIIISVISILVLCVVIERVTHMVINPVKKLTKVITAMTNGDFTVSVTTEGNDEIGVMSRSVEQFIESMKRMLSSMGDISGRLGRQADSSDNVSREMHSAASIQSQSMSELNMTVDQLSISVNEIADNATRLAGVVSDTKDDSLNVENKMRETVRVSQKGRGDMERVGEALEDIRTSIENLKTAVNKVGTASGEIVQIVQLIGSIAEETNLLSLNASIEAARAGEAGRGFAVVASEIGTLASNSTASVEHISRLIDQVNSLVGDTVRQAGDSAEHINESSKLIDTAIETFDVIFNNIQETSDLIDQMVEKINQVDEVATNVAAISEEQAASSDEILATSESMLEQAKGIAENSQHVANESRSLTESSEELAKQVGLFRI